jgi:hypothetical protein
VFFKLVFPVSKHNAVQEYKERGVKAPRILNVGTRRR